MNSHVDQNVLSFHRVHSQLHLTFYTFQTFIVDMASSSSRTAENRFVLDKYFLSTSAFFVMYITRIRRKKKEILESMISMKMDKFMTHSDTNNVYFV